MKLKQLLQSSNQCSLQRNGSDAKRWHYSPHSSSFVFLVSHRIQITLLMCSPSKQPVLEYVQPWQHGLSSCLSQWPAKHNTANHHKTADRSKVITSLRVPCQAWRLWVLHAASTQTNYLTLFSTSTPVCFWMLSRSLASFSPIYLRLFLHSCFSLLLSFSILPKLFLFPFSIHAVVQSLTRVL